MKKIIFGLVIFTFITNITAQQGASEKYYKFGEEIFNWFKTKNTDAIINKIDAELNDTQIEAVSASVITTLEQIQALGGLDNAKLLNVLYKNLPSGNKILYIPFLKNNKIRTIRIGGVLERGNKLYIYGPVKLAPEQKDKALSEGYSLFLSKCFACHGRYGEGTIGPNLTDDYWKFVENESDIIEITKKGKPGTMMIAYEKYLTDDQINKIARYIKLMHHQKIKKGKAPEGKKVIFEKKIY